MNQTFDHKYVSSLKEYIDHKIVKGLRACRKATLNALPVSNDDRMSSYKVYSCGDRQFLYDSSAIDDYTAPVVKSGNNTLSGSRIDYKNARIINDANSSLPSDAKIEAFQKFFNIYVTSMSDEDILRKMEPSASRERLQQSVIKGDSYLAPCIFVKVFNSQNEGFCLGGEDKTKMTFKLSIFVNSEFEMLALQNVIRDLNSTSTYILNNTPLNEFNDIKSNWNFLNEVQTAKAAGNKRIYIEDVKFSPVNVDNIDSKFANTYIGVATLNTCVYRNPRA